MRHLTFAFCWTVTLLATCWLARVVIHVIELAGPGLKELELLGE